MINLKKYKKCTLKQLLEILNKCVEENPKRLDYNVLVEWSCPEIEIIDIDEEDANYEYNKHIFINC